MQEAECHILGKYWKYSFYQDVDRETKQAQLDVVITVSFLILKVFMEGVT